MRARDDVAGAQGWLELPDGEQVVAAEAFGMLADPIRSDPIRSDPTRLRLLWLLSRGEGDVSSLVEQVGVARPAVSQHLGKLRLAGLVTSRREGRRAVYRARGGHVRRLLDEALRAADHRLTGAPEHD